MYLSIKKLTCLSERIDVAIQYKSCFTASFNHTRINRRILNRIVNRRKNTNKTRKFKVDGECLIVDWFAVVANLNHRF